MPPKSILPDVFVPIKKIPSAVMPSEAIPSGTIPSDVIFSDTIPSGTIPINDIRNILSKIEYNGKILKEENINQIIRMGITNPDVLYEIVCDALSYSNYSKKSNDTDIDIYLSKLHNYIESKSRTNTEIILNDITFEKQKEQTESDNEKMKRDTVVQSGFPCPKCKSTQTISIDMQLRSGDEGMANITKCYNCGQMTKR